MLKKYIITGNIVEVYSYQNYIRGKGGANRTEATADDVENALKNYANTNQRRRDMVRRLACCNFNAQYDKFFTLTFADNLTDVKKANYLFKKFKQKLQYKFGKDIKYLGVVEFQDRGAVHYHVLSNIPYIPQRDLQDLWGHGFVFINAINHVDNIGAYIVKYMTKDTTDTRLQGLKAYLCSRNLIRPEEIVNHDLKEFKKLEDIIEKKYHLSEINAEYESTYETEMLGTCEYKQYNVDRISNENILNKK